MRIHTSASYADVSAAARAAKAELRVTFHKSRTHDRAFEVTLRGDSKRAPNVRHPNGEKAATWDQWGIFLAHLFEVDPDTRCGGEKRPIYRDADDFYFQTDGRFDEGVPFDMHGDHRFKYHALFAQKCTKCTAVRRWSLV